MKKPNKIELSSDLYIDPGGSYESINIKKKS